MIKFDRCAFRQRIEGEKKDYAERCRINTYGE